MKIMFNMFCRNNVNLAIVNENIYSYEDILLIIGGNHDGIYDCNV